MPSINPLAGNAIQSNISTAQASRKTIQHVQNALNQLHGTCEGCQDGELDGVTEKAIRQFQQSHGLPKTGQIDDRTLNALERDRRSAVTHSAQPLSEAPSQRPVEAEGRSRRRDVMFEGQIRHTMISNQLAPGQVMAPSGVPYSDKAVVDDSECIFTNGQLDPVQVLSKMSQCDENHETTSDPARCGAMSVIASAIMAKGPQGLLDVIDGLTPLVTSQEDRDKLAEIYGKIQRGEATYGDIGVLAEIIVKTYGTDMGDGTIAINAGDLYDLYVKSGLQVPTGPGKFTEGQSYPLMYDMDNDGTNDHYLVYGRTQDGKYFVYDPQPTPGRSQVHVSGNPDHNYEDYKQEIKNRPHSTYIPLTEAGAEKAKQQ